MNIEKYALTNDLTPNDVIELVKPEFPKFSKVQYSMCKNPNYGVVLAPKAVRALNEAHPAKEKKRSRQNRITVWMNDYLYSLMLSKCESESRTMQDVAEMAIYSYLKPEALRMQPHELNSKLKERTN